MDKITVDIDGSEEINLEDLDVDDRKLEEDSRMVGIYRLFLDVQVVNSASAIVNFVIEEENPVLDILSVPYKVANDYTFHIFL